MGNLPSINNRFSSIPNRIWDPHPELNGNSSEEVIRSSLVTAVISNNVGILRMLLKKIDVNVKDKEGNTLLHGSIVNDRKDIFKLLINHPNIDINNCDNNGWSPLVQAVSSFGIYYVKKLVKKGADVNKADRTGYTPLHCAIHARSPELCHILISAGSDVNAQTVQGITPMHLAVHYNNPEVINMLLYFGADVSIPDNLGFLPLMQEDINSLRLILYSYTFDENPASIHLKILTRAMIIKWPGFPKIFKNISHVIYNDDDLQDFSDALADMKSEHLELFIEKFGCVFKEMLCFCTLSNYLVAVERMKKVTSDVIDVLYIPLLSECRFEFIESCCSSVSLISSLVKIFHKNKLQLSLLTNLVCCFLSYGAKVTCKDLSAVYTIYGRCDLFEILLHMDIESLPIASNCCNIYDHEVVQQSIMSYFIYDVNLNVAKFLRHPQSYLLMDLDVLLEYFALPELKEFFLADGEASEKIKMKIERLPSVPSLVELARNASRDFIVSKFRVKNSREFYTILRVLPMSRVYKEIISFERKLYITAK